jgi:hypothetical protein
MVATYFVSIVEVNFFIDRSEVQPGLVKRIGNVYITTAVSIDFVP